MTTFTGVIPILATPFSDDEQIDLESWQRLIEFMVGCGVDGITILGVLGESNRLTDEERGLLIKTAAAVAGGRATPAHASSSTCPGWQKTSAPPRSW
jgi:dihydrodipicolinate synthase/N-acetylneuraminate lyase